MEKLEKGPWEINWEKLQAMGILKYSILSGLALGLTPFVVKKLMDLWETPFSELFLTMDFVGGAIAALIGGFVGFGILTWYVNEYWYRRALRHIEEHNSQLVTDGEEQKKIDTGKTSLEHLEKPKEKEPISLKPSNDKNSKGKNPFF